MTPTKSSKERFFQSCMSGDLNTIKTELFYNVSPFSQDKVTIVCVIYFSVSVQNKNYLNLLFVVLTNTVVMIFW